ncbi:SPOR domain-containing protein [Marinobacter sp. DUT-3]|uniref:SPOR domain-containing protein n=1 Tax=Marinobacter sp. DUT-3 TaxID=3412036 RepID=UPI003D16514D
MDGLKQRIIGALVLVSLAVIFVPMLFDEPHSERTSNPIKIPEEPPFPEVDAPEPPEADAPAYRLEETDEPEPVADRDSQQVQRVEEPVEQAPEPQPEPEAAPEEPVSQPVADQSRPEPDDGEEPQQAGSAEYAGSLEGAWVVQLGSFGSADNARNLRNKVRDTGYSSHLQEIQRGDATLTRVFSGPFAEKAEAERAKKALDREFGLNSLVTTGDK